MLSTEQKRQIFIRLRKENYQASLRLEGFKPNQPALAKQSAPPTLAELKAKYVR